MNKTFFFCFLLLCAAGYAQDTLCLLNGSKLPVRVSSLTMSHILYRDTGTTLTKEKIMPKSQVRYLVYNSGRFEVMSLSNISPDEMNFSFRKGQQDASVNYTGRRSGAVGTGVTSFLTGGILGLVPAVICSSVRPNTLNLALSREAPVSDKSYMLGYIAAAKRIKRKKVWTGYAIGLFSGIAAYMVMR
jgi:hypothetical protein